MLYDRFADTSASERDCHYSGTAQAHLKADEKAIEANLALHRRMEFCKDRALLSIDLPTHRPPRIRHHHHLHATASRALRRPLRSRRAIP